MKRILPYIAIVSIPFLLGMCSTVEDPTDNPFGDNGGIVVTPDTADPTSMVGLHKYIFAVKCANPTCHDGSFEPDFRTVESSYQTLVYHPVIKNTDDEDFDFRVVPNDYQASWLYERLITTDDVIGRMPLYAPALTDEELGWVRTWIQNGAPDADGNPSIYPNQPPSVEGFAMFNAQNQRIDTARMVRGQLSPIVLPNNEAVTMYVLVEDDSTSINDLQVNQGKFSYDEFDFSNAVVKQAVPVGGIAHGLNFNTNEFTPGDTVWFRYYVQDTDNPDIVEFPNSNSPFYMRLYSSFVVQ